MLAHTATSCCCMSEYWLADALCTDLPGQDGSASHRPCNWSLCIFTACYVVQYFATRPADERTKRESAACRVSPWGDRSTEKGRCTRKSAQYSRTVCNTARKRAASELLWYTKASVHSYQVLTCFLALIWTYCTHPANSFCDLTHGTAHCKIC